MWGRWQTLFRSLIRRPSVVCQTTLPPTHTIWLVADPTVVKTPLLFNQSPGVSICRYHHLPFQNKELLSKLTISSALSKQHCIRHFKHPFPKQVALQSFSSRPSSGGESSKQNPLLVRDFILDSLYNPRYGYFASQSAVVGRIPEPIDFSKLWGKAGYTKLLSKLYREIGSSWLTPVELFQPWYGCALARFIRQTRTGSQLQETSEAKTGSPWVGGKKRSKSFSKIGANTLKGGIHSNSGPLQIYEIGGGCGTCALNILDYFEQNDSESYKQIRYTSIEISESLAAEQRKTVYAKRQHQSKFKVEVRDAADLKGWGPPNDEPCFVIMLEVLDNLPHDRVFRSSRHDPWLETRVTSSPPEMTSPSSEVMSSSPKMTSPQNALQDPFERDESPSTATPSPSNPDFKEIVAPIRDPLILRCLAAIEPGDSEPRPVATKANIDGLLAVAREFFGGLAAAPEGLEVLWLPTGALKLLETLYRARPNMCLVAADFDQLPDVRIEGRNAPLVASKADGVTQDQPTYLVPPGSADIFFPTDFDALERLNVAAAGASRAGHVPSATSASTREFMEQFADMRRTKTRTGFNPLLEDYLNTRIFVSHAGH